MRWDTEWTDTEAIQHKFAQILKTLKKCRRRHCRDWIHKEIRCDIEDIEKIRCDTEDIEKYAEDTEVIAEIADLRIQQTVERHWFEFKFKWVWENTYKINIKYA